MRWKMDITTGFVMQKVTLRQGEHRIQPWPMHPRVVPYSTCRYTSCGPYKFDNFAFDGVSVFTQHVPGGIPRVRKNTNHLWSRTKH